MVAAGKLLAKYDGQLPTRLWIAPPTRMDETQLVSEGYYSTYGKVGARTEMPGCSLCMGNQARVADKSTVVSTSTRNFPNRFIIVNACRRILPFIFLFDIVLHPLKILFFQ